MSHQFKRSKVTPLSLFTQVHQNSVSAKSRQSMLSFLHDESARINNRYGEVLDNRNNKSKPQLQVSTQPIEQEEEEKQRKQEVANFRSRFHSMQRVKRNSTRDKSPYLSQERRRKRDRLQLKTEPDSMNSRKIEQVLKNRMERNRSKQEVVQKKTSNSLATMGRKLCVQKTKNSDKIFKHFQNLLKIYKSFSDKKQERQIIEAVKEYVLEDEGDSAEVEEIYESPEVVRACKHILFFQKILVILVVDLIITHRLRIAEANIQQGMEIMVGYYRAIYQDLKSKMPDFPSQDYLILEKGTLDYLQKDAKTDGRGKKRNRNVEFPEVQESLSAKIKHCFKFSKDIQAFYKHHLPLVQNFTANLNYFRLLEFYSMSLLSMDWSAWNIDFLQTCPSPYLHYDCPKKYTLLLDLDETLIHYKVTNKYQGQFLIRPYMFEFLAEMAHYYEIGIFTCSMPEYADIIINHMKEVTFRLYRHHTIKINNEYVKDIERVGRSPQTMLIVDNLPRNFRLQNKSGIFIRSWYGDKKDMLLKKLSLELKRVAESGAADLRQLNFLRSFP